MDKYTALILSFLAFGGMSLILFGLCWALWAGPRRIRQAVLARLGPAALQASIRTSLVYWVVVSVAALILAGIVAYYLWLRIGLWLYDDTLLGSWKERLATWLSGTIWAMTMSVAGLEYERTLPLGVVLAGFLGLVAGAWLGTKLGRLAAAKRFLITSAMS